MSQVTTTDIIQAICAIITALATSIGFIFVIRQLRIARKANQISTYENLFSRMHDIHMFFFSNPTFTQYFYDSKPVGADHVDAQKIKIVVEMYADFLQQIKLQSDLMPKKTAEGWCSYAESVVKRSPALREFFKQHPDWYPSNFYKESN